MSTSSSLKYMTTMQKSAWATLAQRESLSGLPVGAAWALRAAMVILALMVVPRLSQASLDALDTTVSRFMLVVAVTILAFVDPISAVLFVAAIALAARQYAAAENGGGSAGSIFAEPQRMLNMAYKYGTNSMAAPETMVSGGMAPFYAEHKQQKETTMGETTSERITGMDTYGPVTQRIPFITDENLANAQNNVVGNLNEEIRTWDNQMGPQGISGDLRGYDYSDAYAPVDAAQPVEVCPDQYS